MFSNDPELVRDRVRDFRKLRKVTQQDLADYVGMTRGAFRSREADGNFSWEQIELIADFFDASPYFLKYGAEEEELHYLATIFKSRGRLQQPQFTIFSNLNHEAELTELCLDFYRLNEEDQNRIQRYLEINDY